MSKMPKQRPGQSEQDVQTPPDFMRAVRKKFGDLSWDLAADANNTQVRGDTKVWFDEADDALVQDWHKIQGMLWCNPPYEKIEPWVAKAYNEAQKGASLLMLVPASTGSNWFRDYVDGKCFVFLLNGRLTFVGHKSPYPKDLVLLQYVKPFADLGIRLYNVWDWKKDL